LTEVEDDDDDHTETDVQITVHRPKPDDYFSPTTVGVKSNKKVKGVKVDQQEKKAAAETKTADVKKENSRKTDVKKEEKKKEVVVNKNKAWFNWWWLLILLVPLTFLICKKYFPVPYARTISFIKKTFSMKQLILLLALSTLAFVSCDAPKENKVEERTSLMRPDVDHDWEIQFVDTTGKFAYQGFNEKGQGTWLTKDSTWKKQKKIARSTFWVTMSQKMVKRFMVLTDYFTKDLLIFTLLLIILAILIRLFIKGDWMRFMGKGGALGFILIAYLGVTIRIVQKRPTELAGNNVKQLSRAEYEYWMKTDPTFEKFWMEKWKNNELVGLTNKEAVK
jgi:hypothetical protein